MIIPTFDKTTPPHILTLVAVAATASSATNIFLPSLPGMAEQFGADYGIVQMTVSLYLAATAVLQLGIGPASDRFGRRPVMLVSFAVFCIATLAGAYAPTIEALLACRVLQAFSASGLVLSRAIVRDIVGTDEAASRIGYVTMGMTLGPMVAPLVGGILDEAYGWRSTFLLTFGFGIVALILIYVDLGETNRHRSSSLTAQFRGYRELVRSHRFWGYVATAGFASGTFFAFLGGGPYVAAEILGLSPFTYGLYFGVVSLGYMLGNFISGRYSRAIGINRMMLSGNAIAALGMGLSIVLFLGGYDHPLSFFGPTFFVGMGNGIALPSATAGMVSVRPHLAGSASGLGGALQIGVGAALATLAGGLLSQETGAYPLMVLMLASSSLGIAATLYVIRVARTKGEL
ncbi:MULTISPECIES: multidrug effflux MFS transporter [Chelativorans]|jgi:DHA1 family bicyclomycin/chloramphenicol resistance-like MFS transporter|uniref:Bcr/CflA family efflux transporter n=1 Tax=Chelativorans sp. (strain BNC1) TaxID=266779 RepID=Q11I19_CHESB|nr:MULTISPECIES: multidrug effflux MFS transporter [Chelativorans]